MTVVFLIWQGPIGLDKKKAWFPRRNANLRNGARFTRPFRARQKGDSKREKPDPERTFSQIFADFRWFSDRSVNQGIWESQICAENRRKPQIFAGNRRKPQKPVSPICCLPFGALLAHPPRPCFFASDAPLQLSEAAFAVQSGSARSRPNPGIYCFFCLCKVPFKTLEDSNLLK